MRNKVLEVAKDFKGANLKFAISNDDDFDEELKTFAFEV